MEDNEKRCSLCAWFTNLHGETSGWCDCHQERTKSFDYCQYYEFDDIEQKHGGVMTTNEEKAKELASKYARQYHHNTYPQQSSNSEFVFSNEEIDKACLKMAEWKDEQMIDFLHGILVQSNLAVIYNMITAKITEMKGENDEK